VTRTAVAWSAVLAACAGALALLFAQVRYPFPFLNDAVLHFGLIESLESAHRRGQSLLDPWVSSWNLGYPVFHYYQNLPHLAVLAFSKLTLGHLSLLHSFRILEWLAIGTLPIPVFFALREFGFPISGAACAAVLSLLIRTNYLTAWMRKVTSGKGSGYSRKRSECGFSFRRSPLRSWPCAPGARWRRPRSSSP
jgi:uncharacterized membrane protein